LIKKGRPLILLLPPPSPHTPPDDARGYTTGKVPSAPPLNGAGAREIRTSLDPDPPPATVWATVWPDSIEGFGPRRVVAFSPCAVCGTGSWCRYGGWVLCHCHAHSCRARALPVDEAPLFGPHGDACDCRDCLPDEPASPGGDAT